ncbi:sugar phosphate isomerase/epimerase family protein [Alicyclobacillus acidocaldarius]|uniref:Xylose isomerase domain protein TIM barrel n=1 Tax=Alicyclobacillus acidocaldarius subsp. acidocaldarius (strain ATCC 27009 / DSM 446 / BCRC 14685 / JCM 5260 / KCTC 1825 / NBRC 15652 / NCIMB 11725 / NRRL B-14509 / 104-IA) TaxID=521098 RepID=C8WQZ6_ALIAD|nr:sugar phosphate isomerase/epimerase [Alicyclobacillus acidocaldarius]ACV59165.1 Xylose isomerase domain protein TIM barrel [Alicyclobacillus acidocaldarius subsp. acidocaldarius DSM 446]
MPEIALQMYTLRKPLEEDFDGTLRRVAEIGFRLIELHHYGPYTAGDLRRRLDELGLRAISAHVPLVRLESEIDGVLEEAQALGLEYVVCPWLPAERREDYAALADVLARASERVCAAGLGFSYHNHDFEFASYEGQTALDWLLERVADAGLELDVYWAHHAGFDPVEIIRRYRGRLDLLHAKDATPDGHFAAVGTGVLPWDAIFQASAEAGVRYVIVEQDVCPGDPFEAIATSLRFLQSRL